MVSRTLNKEADGAHLEVILVIHKQVNLKARRSDLKILNTKNTNLFNIISPITYSTTQ